MIVMEYFCDRYSAFRTDQLAARHHSYVPYYQQIVEQVRELVKSAT